MNVLAARSTNTTLFSVLFAALLILFSSCSVVKDYPARRPFVYNTQIELEGKFSTDQRKELIDQLEEQLHDSIRVRRLDKLIGWEKGPRFFYSVLRKPPLYDSLNADKSITYMEALLHSMGYYRDTITYRAEIDTAGAQYRTIVNFRVTPGTQFKVDSLAYNFRYDTIVSISQPTKDTLQQVTNDALGTALLKKGDAFAKPQIAAERERLTDVYRNNGYLRFSSDELIVLWDTVGRALLRPTLDPIEQVEQLEALRQRRQNPTASVEFRLRANPDTSHLIRYHVGNVTIYPDLTADTIRFESQNLQHRGYNIISYQNLFKPKVVTENIYLKRGELYSQRNYLKTLNRYNSMGAWRLVSIDQIPRGITDTVDFVVKLTVARKYISEINLEGSQNWGSTLTAGNLIGVNYRLQNRNLGKAANQSNTSFRYGIELAKDQFIRSQQFSFGQTITFPRLIPRFGVPQTLRENARTTFVFNGNYINHYDYYNILSLNGSWGYEFNWKNKLLSIRIPNIEFAVLDEKQGLKDLIDSNQSYKYIFNDGLVTSNIVSLTLTESKKNITNYARFNTEYSGLLLGLVAPNSIKDRMYRFIKLDADLRKTISIRKSALAFRFFGGAGYGLPFDLGPVPDSSNFYLPFFKAYFAGGANSMRAWQLRKLGPGSAQEPFDEKEAPERYGDMQLEFNAEYRFFLANIRGVLLNSAFYTDIGNIWYLRENEDFKGGNFKPNNLFKDLAVGVGTGIRIDFGLFLIRLDYAYKAKNPNIEDNSWFPDWENYPGSFKLKDFFRNLGKGQFQLGVTYPF